MVVTLPNAVTLAELAQILAELPGLKRLRLGSVEPPEVTDRAFAGYGQPASDLSPFAHSFTSGGRRYFGSYGPSL